MKNTKRLLMLLLLSGTAFAVAGCGESSGTDTGPDGTSSNEPISNGLESAYKLLKKAYSSFKVDRKSTLEMTKLIDYTYSDETPAEHNEHITKLTFDVDNLSFAQTETYIYETAGVDAKTTYNYAYRYEKDDEGNVLYYERNDDDKYIYKSHRAIVESSNNGDYLYTWDVFDLFDISDDLNAFTKYFERFYLGYAYVEVSYSAEVKDGIQEFVVKDKIIDISDDSLSNWTYTDEYHFFIDVGKECFTSLKYDCVSSYSKFGVHVGEQVESQEITYSGAFDEEFYDSFDKEGYVDSGEGERFGVPVYFENDYYCDRNVLSFKCGASGTSYNYFEDACEFYYDKEFTRKYNGEEVIPGSVDRFYAKPVSLGEDYASIFIFDEVTSIDPSGFFEPSLDKDYRFNTSVSTSGGESSIYTLQHYEDEDGKKIGKMYVNGVETTEDKIIVEPGEVYIIENKYTLYEVNSYYFM